MDFKVQRVLYVMSILLCLYLNMMNMIRGFCWFHFTLNRCFSEILGVTAGFKDHTQLHVV